MPQQPAATTEPQHDPQPDPTPGLPSPDPRPLSERLHEVAREKRAPWPEDDYVPHERARGRQAVADAVLPGAIMQGGAGRI